MVNNIDNASSWHPSKESPDYYNICGTGIVGVPTNFAGYQYPHTGNAYAGFAAFGITAYNLREYFTCPLIANLTIGSKYAVTMYINLAGGSWSRIACNKLGMLFSTVNYDLLNNPPTNNYCQFHSDSIGSIRQSFVQAQYPDDLEQNEPDLTRI